MSRKGHVMGVTTTLLQVDIQNLFYGARRRKKKMDLEKVLAHFKARETEFITEALVYMIRGDNFDSSRFESILKNIGYTIRVNESRHITKESGEIIYRQKTHEVGITIDCIDKMDTYDKWILMSGDGDFVRLCEYVQSKGKQIEIWSFEGSYNKKMERYGEVNFIDKKFFLETPRISVFGFNWNWGP